MTREESIRLQLRLGITPDGILGRNSWRALFDRFGNPGVDVGKAVALGRGAAVHLDDNEINTPLRVAHWLAQVAHESGGFRYMNEIWGPTEAQKGYEGRKDLGNVMKGDGRLFAGRGILQLTGRANYETYANKLGLDLVDHPEIAAMPSISVMIAARYWKDRWLNTMADADDIEGITRRVNGGLNGLADRKEWLAKAKALLL